MNFDNISKEVVLHCRTCGNTQFVYDDEIGCLNEAPLGTLLTCADCGALTMKGDLIDDNDEEVQFAINQLVDDVVMQIKKKLPETIEMNLCL